jgi:hypothetical protein
MNKLILSENGYVALAFNPDTLELKEHASMNNRIDNMFLVEYPCEVILGSKIVNCVAGDIVCKMYGYNGEKDFIIINSKELVEFNKVYELKRDEERAKYKNSDQILGKECNDTGTVQSN